MKRIKRPVRVTAGGMGYPSSIKEGQVQAKYVAGKGVVLFTRVNGQIIEFPGMWQRTPPEKLVPISTSCTFWRSGTMLGTAAGTTYEFDLAGYPGSTQVSYMPPFDGICIGMACSLTMSVDGGAASNALFEILRNGVAQSMTLSLDLGGGAGSRVGYTTKTPFRINKGHRLHGQVTLTDVDNGATIEGVSLSPLFIINNFGANEETAS